MYSRAMREAARVTGGELARALQPVYKRINKTTVSMVDNTEDYGVRFTKEAETQALEYLEQRAETVPNRKQDRHRLKRQVRMRLTEEAYVEFERLREQSGFSTVQGFLEHIFYLYREENSNEDVYARGI